MSKIMVVEDDTSLREIYTIRLTAEGYEVVSASDGEEALAIAVKEKPDLILSDVMMPKISGFDMLDILRQTPETKNIKVIMMTALSSNDQRARGEGLGADKYLVKSQVGIEDMINAIHETLGDKGTPAPEASAQQVSEPAPATTPVPTPEAPAVSPAETPAPVPEAPIATPVPMAETPVAAPAPTLGATPVQAPTPAQAPVTAPAPTKSPTPTPNPIPAPALETPAQMQNPTQAQVPEVPGNPENGIPSTQ